MPIDPLTAINLAIIVANEAINLVKAMKAESGLTDEQLAAVIDAKDLQNKADIKTLLAL